MDLKAGRDEDLEIPGRRSLRRSDHRDHRDRRHRYSDSDHMVLASIRSVVAAAGESPRLKERGRPAEWDQHAAPDSNHEGNRSMVTATKS